MKILFAILLLITSKCTAQDYLGKTEAYLRQHFNKATAPTTIKNEKDKLVIRQIINNDIFNVKYVFKFKNGTVDEYTKFMPNDLLWQNEVVKWIQHSNAQPASSEYGVLGDYSTPICNLYALGNGNMLRIIINEHMQLLMTFSRNPDPDF